MNRYTTDYYDSSGTLRYNSLGDTRYVEPKKNCDNCGSNLIVANECQHCGTWHGHGQKSVKIQPPIRYYTIPDPPKKKSFWRRFFRIIRAGGRP